MAAPRSRAAAITAAHWSAGSGSGGAAPARNAAKVSRSCGTRYWGSVSRRNASARKVRKRSAQASPSKRTCGLQQHLGGDLDDGLPVGYAAGDGVALHCEGAAVGGVHGGAVAAAARWLVVVLVLSGAAAAANPC